MKYIDADKLKSYLGEEAEKEAKKIDYSKTDIDKFFHVGCRAMAHDVSNFIDSLKQKQPSLPSNLDEAAEKATEEYVYKEGGPFPGTTGVSFINGFKAGAKWMAEQ